MHLEALDNVVNRDQTLKMRVAAPVVSGVVSLSVSTPCEAHIGGIRCDGEEACACKASYRQCTYSSHASLPAISSSPSLRNRCQRSLRARIALEGSPTIERSCALSKLFDILQPTCCVLLLRPLRRCHKSVNELEPQACAAQYASTLSEDAHGRLRLLHVIENQTKCPERRVWAH